MKGYIYQYTFPDGKVYIGQTRRDVQERHKEHISPSTGPSCRGFWKAYQKFGDNYELEILNIIYDDDIEALTRKLNYIETLYIQEKKASNPNYGYNIRAFGESHTHQPTKYDEIFKKVWHKLYDEILKEKMILFNSVCEKIFKTQIPFTDEEKEFVKTRCLNHTLFSFPDSFKFDNLKWNLNQEDPSFSFKVKETLGLVKFDLKEETKSYLESWRTSDPEGFSEYILLVYDSEEGIVALDKDGNEIMSFLTLEEVAEYFKVKRPANVWNVLKGKQKTAYGYQWKYRKDICI